MAEVFATRAGRAFRREGTGFVDADPAKGMLLLEFADDELLHLRWRTRDGSTSARENTDLIVFPSDASLQKISDDPTVRMYVLKFQSSDQLHFFWFQDPDSTRDADDVIRINKLLNDIELQPTVNQPEAADVTLADSNTNNPPSAAVPAGPLSRTELNSFVQVLMRNLQQGNARAGVTPDLSLTDILTPSTLAVVLQDPNAVESLTPFLPAELLSPSSPVADISQQDVLRRIVASAPFRSSVRSLDQALSTGLLGGLVTNLGLPAEAGLGVHPFLEAVQTQATTSGELERGADKNKSMETE